MAKITRRAEAATVLAILVIVFSSIMAGVGLAAFVSVVTGSWPTLDLPVPVRLLGAFLAAVGVFSIVIVSRYRSLRDVLDSTAVTMLKFYHRTPLERPEGRTERFIPTGPYRYVRNPMYFGAVCIAFGLAVALSAVAGLFWGTVLTIWFWFVWIPFEEKELDALFGDSYRDYKRRVPKLFPYGRSYRA
ncbi:MAG: isoprenylcysteine carboxylmethyltransferase family protein [Nitrososphaerales archaeon]|nr:isoprenylcysteine carboxylmethyltransferase family protein [Nitrososphaerales archaeon]